jgi:hypothetical protein
MDGGSTELINRLAWARCVKVTIFQCFHKILHHFPLYLFQALNKHDRIKEIL